MHRLMYMYGQLRNCDYSVDWSVVKNRKVPRSSTKSSRGSSSIGSSSRTEEKVYENWTKKGMLPRATNQTQMNKNNKGSD